jgi:hypothetical protein
MRPVLVRAGSSSPGVEAAGGFGDDRKQAVFFLPPAPNRYAGALACLLSPVLPSAVAVSPALALSPAVLRVPAPAPAAKTDRVRQRSDDVVADRRSLNTIVEELRAERMPLPDQDLQPDAIRRSDAERQALASRTLPLSSKSLLSRNPT